MSRRRYISTDISTDIKLAELAEHGTLPLLLYTWAIPHMDDWGRMSGDPRQFKLTVCPALDVTSKDIDAALSLIHDTGLWLRYEVDGKKCICIPEDRWFKHQSYINKSKRSDDQGSNFPSPQITEERRRSPKDSEEQQEIPDKAASFSLSPSPSKSLMDGLIETVPENFYQAHKRVFGFDCNPLQAEKLAVYIDQDGLDEAVIIRAFERAAIKGKAGYSFNLITGILDTYFKNGVQTLEQAIKIDDAHDANRSQAPPNPYLNKSQQRRNAAAELRRQAREERQSGQS